MRFMLRLEVGCGPRRGAITRSSRSRGSSSRSPVRLFGIDASRSADDTVEKPNIPFTCDFGRTTQSIVGYLIRFDQRSIRQRGSNAVGSQTEHVEHCRHSGAQIHHRCSSGTCRGACLFPACRHETNSDISRSGSQTLSVSRMRPVLGLITTDDAR